MIKVYITKLDHVMIKLSDLSEFSTSTSPIRLMGNDVILANNHMKFVGTFNPKASDVISCESLSFEDMITMEGQVYHEQFKAFCQATIGQIQAMVLQIENGELKSITKFVCSNGAVREEDIPL